MKIPEILIIETVHQPGSLAKVLQVVAEAGLTIEHLTAIRRDQGRTVWELTLEMDEEAEPRYDVADPAEQTEAGGAEAAPDCHTAAYPRGWYSSAHERAGETSYRALVWIGRQRGALG